MPREKWSQKFAAHIARLVHEALTRVRGDHEIDSKEAERKSSYRQYFRILRLDTNKLQKKKILDLGSGDGDFVIYCLEKGITKQADGIDLLLGPAEFDEPYRKHFFRGDLRDPLPVKDCDLIVAVGSLEMDDFE